jgi:hypothetical protein
MQTTSGKKSQIAKWQINGRLICRHHWFVNTLGQGRIQGRKIVIFHMKYPKNFRASLGSAQFF